MLALHSFVGLLADASTTSQHMVCVFAHTQGWGEGKRNEPWKHILLAPAHGYLICLIYGYVLQKTEVATKSFQVLY